MTRFESEMMLRFSEWKKADRTVSLFVCTESG